MFFHWNIYFLNNWFYSQPWIREIIEFLCKSLSTGRCISFSFIIKNHIIFYILYMSEFNDCIFGASVVFCALPWSDFFFDIGANWESFLYIITIKNDKKNHNVIERLLSEGAFLFSLTLQFHKISHKRQS